MSIEIEKKYRLRSGDRAQLASLLRECGAEFRGRDFEVNTIFSGAPLGDQGAIVRIRKTEARTILTYKRRIETEFDVKKQIEHEVDISDADVAEAILAELGLRPRLIYEKYRDTWNLRSVEVVLDELPFGDFMEIEGTITAIKEAEILLRVDDLETEHETYPRLTAGLGKQNGDVIEARFDQRPDIS